jgi:hypothetical protein
MAVELTSPSCPVYPVSSAWAQLALCLGIPQVFVLALTFLVLFLGNFLTTLKVVHAKLQKNRNKTKQP